MARVLITSALPYINGVKHLGNLIGSQLPSDLYARYLRAKNNEVLLICATDEHGTPAELAAEKAGLPVDEFCENMWKQQKKLAAGFLLSFDYFGRSSSKRNHDLTQHFAAKLHDNGFINEVIENQFYSINDMRFLPDRYLEGKCPSCGYEKARGDQCENCTKQLNPTDLIEPKSTISGTKEIELRKTKHLYLRQSLMKKELQEWLNTKNDWPLLTTSIAQKWLSDGKGLQDRGITRDLKWGIPVRKGAETWPGLEKKVFYVWFDAPIEYISATAEWADAEGNDDSCWHRWWRTDLGAEDVHYVQFMAKDNIPFHTLSFPATIMGSKEPWKLVDYIKGFNWLLYEGGKFSTSEGRGVFMDQALEALPADYWRWWLLANAPESADTDFTWESFQSVINKDLADVFGNFVSRVTKFCQTKFGHMVPPSSPYGDLEKTLIKELTRKIKVYEDYLDKIEIRKAAAELRSIWALGNEYLQQAAPWSEYKSDVLRAGCIIKLSLNTIALYSSISSPFIPQTSHKLDETLNIDGNNPWPNKICDSLELLGEGHEFKVPENLFDKLTDNQIAEFITKFGGRTTS